MGRLENKVAIITGAANGQGAVEAELFAKEGASVIATDLQEETLAALVESINKDNGNDKVIGLKHDVSSEDSWKEIVEEAISRFGKIDILVNNAGISGKQGIHVEEYTLDEWQAPYNVNATGNFLGVKTVVPFMKKNGSGSIINISSTAAMVGGQGGIPYHASKGATTAMTKALALELSEYNIRVNSVHPGIVETPMFKNAVDDELEKHLKSKVPVGILGQPEDIAYPVLLLASDESKFMTGSEIVVDGGTLSQ